MRGGRVVGLSCVALALVVNQPMLERFVLSDGYLDSPRLQLALVVGDVVLLILGSALLLGLRSFRPPPAGLVLLSIAGGLLAGEFAARFNPRYAPRPRWFVGDQRNRPGQNFVMDSSTGWRMRPNHSFDWEVSGRRCTYRSNTDGFRGGRELGADSGRSVVVLIGDSFTFGSGVEYDETFGALLERTVPQAVVSNLAMPGFGLDQIFLSLRYQAPILHPQLIIFAFIDDDLRRSLTAYMDQWGLVKPMFVLDHDSLRRAAPSDRPPRIVTSLERSSWLWTAGRMMFAPSVYRRSRGTWWRLNAALLRASVMEGRRQGVPLLFVRLPESPRLHPEFALMRALLDSLHADYLDLDDSTRGIQRPIHLEHDNHLSPDGHRYVADVLARWVRREMPDLAGGGTDNPSVRGQR